MNNGERLGVRRGILRESYMYLVLGKSVDIHNLAAGQFSAMSRMRIPEGLCSGSLVFAKA